MDDLSGLNWTSSGPDKAKAPSFNQGPSYPTLRPTPPISGRSSPFPAPQQINPPSSGLARSNASTPANDSFANLVSFNAANGNRNISLQEQQRKLREEQVRPNQGNTASPSSQPDDEFWEKLGSGASTPNPITSPPPYAASTDYGGHIVSKAVNEPFAGIDMRPKKPMQPLSKDDDLLSGFNTEASYWETEQQKIVMEDKTHAPISNSRPLDSKNGNGSMADDDDILGLLGRPVSEFAQPEPQPAPQPPKVAKTSQADQALAELVDMGFDAAKSKRALETTDTGVDVQSAVGWLLNQAHQESTKRSERSQSRQARMSPPRKQSPANESAQPAWMRESSRGGSQQRQNSRSPINGENPSKLAAELGNNFFKTANSIWKTGTKKLNQAVAEINSDSDSSQPKWMREREVRTSKAKPSSHASQDSAIDRRDTQTAGAGDIARPAPNVTDEALMLESGDARPPPRKPPRPKPETNLQGSHNDLSPSSQKDLHQPRFLQQSTPKTSHHPVGRLSRQTIEQQTAEAYISPARRKKTTPKPPSPESDLLFGASNAPSKTSVAPAISKKPSQPSIQRPTTSSPQQPANAIPRPSPRIPKRNIPPISPSALRSSHTSRQAGTASFKRGDYSEAANHYSSALAPLPPTHLLAIPLLTNRALSHLKTGDPKNCIADSNTALDLIGSTRGVGETIDLGDEGNKDMFSYWGKAMTRQAEALEQLERWADAGVAWKTCVEAGVGGSTSIAGRNRCDKVVKGPGPQNASGTAPRPTTTKRPPPKPRPTPKISALDDLSGHSASATAPSAESGEAVTRLRAANLEAERLDDERFALSDRVSERVARWRNGKEGNLRALLASLDAVLWEGSGWKKVGMGELILAGKVKVVYMKGIGKVHPDKLPTTATTEQRMVSAAVFATLNEAWDGFKRENGL
ncbi:MAG: hypothetical protein Q9215_006654 [Flavoplaca cf. flavocitrina]